MPHVLIVEDEPSIADTLIFVLQAEGFTTTWKTLANDALALLKHAEIDLIIMDVGLPDISGFEACKLLRKFSDVPVIFLTARGNELDRIIGLEIGADDYVVKPFSPREVATRVKTILKRTRLPMADTTKAQEFVVDNDRLQIFYKEQQLQLTRLEFRLLKTIVEQPLRVFTRDQLLTAVGITSDAGYDRTIDTHIKSVRAKLRHVSPDAEPIQTQRGFGYCYQPEQK